MKQIFLLRRMVSLVSNDGSASATERVLERLAKTNNNKEFLNNLNKAGQDQQQRVPDQPEQRGLRRD
jgi:transcription termination factor Rho